MSRPTETRTIVFFDGLCNLCDDSVQLIIKHDPKNYFYFASLQSDFAREFLGSNPKKILDPDSIVLWQNGKLYERSSAALRIAKKMSGFYPLLFGLIIIPKFIRDFVYDIFAQNRYQWYGKKNACMIPTPELKARFFG
jgi:predicted DCC family thiol-disulfide oxidoreductase YuxK